MVKDGNGLYRLATAGGDGYSLADETGAGGAGGMANDMVNEMANRMANDMVIQGG